MEPQLIHTIMIWSGIGFIFFIVTMLAITDVLRKTFSSTGAKAFWAIVALIPFVGWLIYLLIGFRKGSVPADDSMP